MADDLGGLFDSDPGFLEELASGNEAVQPQPGMQGMNAQNAGQMQSNMHGRQAGFANMTSNQNSNYGNMQFQNQQQQQAQQFNQSNFNQFNNQPMFNQNTIISQGHSQGHMNPMMSQQTQVVGNQFQNQPATQQQGMISQNQGMFQYNNPPIGSANQAQQQQQMKMQQMGWNQQPQQVFTQQQQSQQSQQTPYLTQHEYVIPKTANHAKNTHKKVYGGVFINGLNLPLDAPDNVHGKSYSGDSMALEF